MLLYVTDKFSMNSIPYIVQTNRMRARPKKQIQRAERRETLMREFHNLSENLKKYISWSIS